MTPKEKAQELTAKHFDIIAKASNYKGLRNEGEAKFYAIEKIAKQGALIAIIEINSMSGLTYGQVQFWQEVKSELEKL